MNTFNALRSSIFTFGRMSRPQSGQTSVKDSAFFVTLHFTPPRGLLSSVLDASTYNAML